MGISGEQILMDTSVIVKDRKTEPESVRIWFEVLKGIVGNVLQRPTLPDADRADRVLFQKVLLKKPQLAPSVRARLVWDGREIPARTHIVEPIFVHGLTVTATNGTSFVESGLFPGSPIDISNRVPISYYTGVATTAISMQSLEGEPSARKAVARVFVVCAPSGKALLEYTNQIASGFKAGVRFGPGHHPIARDNNIKLSCRLSLYESRDLLENDNAEGYIVSDPVAITTNDSVAGAQNPVYFDLPVVYDRVEVGRNVYMKLTAKISPQSVPLGAPSVDEPEVVLSRGTLYAKDDLAEINRLLRESGLINDPHTMSPRSITFVEMEDGGRTYTHPFRYLQTHIKSGLNFETQAIILYHEMHHVFAQEDGTSLDVLRSHAWIWAKTIMAFFYLVENQFITRNLPDLAYYFPKHEHLFSGRTLDQIFAFQIQDLTVEMYSEIIQTYPDAQDDTGGPW